MHSTRIQEVGKNARMGVFVVIYLAKTKDVERSAFAAALTDCAKTLADIGQQCFHSCDVIVHKLSPSCPPPSTAGRRGKERARFPIGFRVRPAKALKEITKGNAPIGRIHRIAALSVEIRGFTRANNATNAKLLNCLVGIIAQFSALVRKNLPIAESTTAALRLLP